MKYILIILISLFISLPSFANPSDKGIICECIKCFDSNEKKKGYYFTQDTVTESSFKLKKDTIIVLNSYAEYSTSITHIKWMWYLVYSLDRKTLILERSGQDTLSTFQCEAFVSDIYKKAINKIKSEYQKEHNLKLKNNKI
tara:strand:+ start:2430 stop:2852 length:423 start_codon:yes stop_codon:yes gene_type:complete